MKKTIQKILINWYQTSDKPLPRWLERACENDESLAMERDLGEDLTVSLKQRPNGSSPIAGDNMAAKVMRQITEEDYAAEQQQGRKMSRGGWVRSAGMAMAVVALVAVAIQFMDTNSQGPVDDVIVKSADPSPTLSADEDLLELGTDWKNPLDQEIEYIVSDAKGALGFLANSFVPSSYLKKSVQDNGNA